MTALDVEAHQGGAAGAHLGRRPVHRHARQFRHAIPEVLRKHMLALGHRIHANLCQEVHSGAKGCGLGERRCASLQPVRDRRIGAALDGDLVDHLAAAEEGRRRLQQISLAPEEADASGPAHLVAARHEPVGPKPLHVNGHVRHALAGIDEDLRSYGVAPLCDPLDRVHAAQHVRDVGHGHQASALAEQALEVVAIEHAVWRQPRKEHLGALLLGDHLPRHEVGVVLHDRDDDLITLTDVGATPGVGHHVDRLRSVPCEDDLVDVVRSDEARYLLARGLEGLR
mmetsp:Transcript_74937/g.193395  ORF Transcript_74937/g.193395 Transcript_74937/m.193395 type:complete len:283 (-) Transcript_74937:553-1401(-)